MENDQKVETYVGKGSNYTLIEKGILWKRIWRISQHDLESLKQKNSKCL